jgi:hypothetical protein
MKADEIARVCHEANRALQIIQNDPGIPVSAPWNGLDPETRQSAIDGVLFRIENPDTTPERSHQNWCDFKLANGWTVGPVKDETLKQHPLLVPYSELPAEAKVKDELFVAVVDALR